jgi:hypothetical protein
VVPYGPAVDVEKAGDQLKWDWRLVLGAEDPAGMRALFAKRRRGEELVIAAEGSDDIGEGCRLKLFGKDARGSGHDVK